MASNEHATSFTVAAMAMNVACFMAISLQVAASAKTYSSRPFHIITIQNTFPVTNLTVHCHSDTKLITNATHSMTRKERFLLGFNPKIEHQWNCTLSTPKTRAGFLCSQKSGEFMMWENREPPICEDNCRWFVGSDGLSLVKQKGANPVHVYNWPSHPNGVHNCKT